MSENPHSKSVHLFFDSFANHLRRIRDEGKDASQAYRAQILLGQLHQFEKAIDEYQGVSHDQGQEEQALGSLLELNDFDSVVNWILNGQQMVSVKELFYLDHLGQWQRLSSGDTPLPQRLKVTEWLDRGIVGRLGDDGTFLAYVHGEPRLVMVLDEERDHSLDLIYFVVRLLPLFVTARVTEAVEVTEADAGMIAKDATFLDLLTLVERVAAKDVTILLEGESGTGKEVLANFIHRHSGRANKPFVAVNCAAIPAGLIESELFGHEKGAFTGAHQRKIGRLEEARGGTLFLDEIGEIELAMQAKLLRFIQLREFHRVGGRQKLSVDIRIVAATNRNLKQRAAEGHFREDLYYRLSVAPFTVPPLRERVDDIVPLARFFLEKYAREFDVSLPEVDGMVWRHLAAYSFPGNVRELENMIQNILVLSQGEKITTAHLPGDLRSLEPAGEMVRSNTGAVRTWRKRKSFGARVRLPRANPTVVASGDAGMLNWIENLPRDNDELKLQKQRIQDFAKDQTLELERRFLEDLLERADGSMPEASRLSNINRTLLYKMLERTKK